MSYNFHPNVATPTFATPAITAPVVNAPTAAGPFVAFCCRSVWLLIRKLFPLWLLTMPTSFHRGSCRNRTYLPLRPIVPQASYLRCSCASSAVVACSEAVPLWLLALVSVVDIWLCVYPAPLDMLPSHLAGRFDIPSH